MMEDAVPFFGLSFCCAYATATAADSSEVMDAATAVTAAIAVSGLSYYCFAVAAAAAAASAKKHTKKGGDSDGVPSPFYGSFHGFMESVHRFGG